MERLEGVTVDQLRAGLDAVDDPTASLRLVVGINYKEGVTQADIAEWYGVSRTTVHNWLTRLERLDSEPLEDVVYDDDRPGRPPKLSADERKQLVALFQASPSDLGLEATSWSPRLARAVISEAFGVDYTLRRVRDLLHDADVEWQTDTAHSLDDAGLSAAAVRDALQSPDSS